MPLGSTNWILKRRLRKPWLIGICRNVTGDVGFTVRQENSWIGQGQTQISQLVHLSIEEREKMGRTWQALPKVHASGAGEWEAGRSGWAPLPLTSLWSSPELFSLFILWMVSFNELSFNFAFIDHYFSCTASGVFVCVSLEIFSYLEVMKIFSYALC